MVLLWMTTGWRKASDLLSQVEETTLLRPLNFALLSIRQSFSICHQCYDTLTVLYVDMLF